MTTETANTVTATQSLLDDDDNDNRNAVFADLVERNADTEATYDTTIKEDVERFISSVKGMHTG